MLKLFVISLAVLSSNAQQGFGPIVGTLGIGGAPSYLPIGTAYGNPINQAPNIAQTQFLMQPAVNLAQPGVLFNRGIQGQFSDTTGEANYEAARYEQSAENGAVQWAENSLNRGTINLNREIATAERNQEIKSLQDIQRDDILRQNLGQSFNRRNQVQSLDTTREANYEATTNEQSAENSAVRWAENSLVRSTLDLNKERATEERREELKSLQDLRQEDILRQDLRLRQPQTLTYNLAPPRPLINTVNQVQYVDTTKEANYEAGRLGQLAENSAVNWAVNSFGRNTLNCETATQERKEESNSYLDLQRENALRQNNILVYRGNQAQNLDTTREANYEVGRLQQSAENSGVRWAENSLGRYTLDLSKERASAERREEVQSLLDLQNEDILLQNTGQNQGVVQSAPIIGYNQFPRLPFTVGNAQFGVGNVNSFVQRPFIPATQIQPQPLTAPQWQTTRLI